MNIILSPRRALRKSNETTDHDNYDLDSLPQYQQPSPYSYEQQDNISQFLQGLRLQNIIRWDQSIWAPFLHPKTSRYTLRPVEPRRSLNSQPLPVQKRPDVPSSKKVRDMDKSTRHTTTSTESFNSRDKPVMRGKVIYVKSNQQIQYEKRKEELIKWLEPLLAPDSPDKCIILLCSGKNSCCEIFPIQVTSTASDTDKWRAVQQGWYEHKGLWRKLVPMFGVRRIEKAKVCHTSNSLLNWSNINIEHKISFKKRHNISSKQIDTIKYWGCYELLADESRREVERLEYIIANHIEAEFPCSYLVDEETFWHEQDCSSQVCPYTCPEANVNDARVKLECLKLRSLFVDAFLDPTVADQNHMLFKEDLVISHL